MTSDHKRFPPDIQRKALARQKQVCACCGTPLAAIGEAGMARHRFGERAEGHHVIPHRSPMNGPITLENCVVICRACHLSVHQGGHWRDVSIYNDIIPLPMAERIARIAALYPFYRG